MSALLERDAGLLDLFESTIDGDWVVDIADDEIVIDCFAGGGGASLGIEWAIGRSPDEAINHSQTAIAIHEANHPTTRHHHSDVWEVDPLDVARGRRVGLLWLSPDCTHFSKAKGGKPVSKKIRILAHVAVRYAHAVRPRVIVLENVEEFVGWGPVSRATGRPDPRRKGQSFRAFVRQLRRLGYAVEWRLLRGCDFGAPTTRRRLFLIARCDGQPIRWPVPTHGKGRPEPWRTAAECIDFSLPCPSIFLTREEAKQVGKALGMKRPPKRPLVAPTLRRVARGMYRFVINTAKPFLVEYHAAKREGDHRVRSVDEPLATQTTENRFGLVVPLLVPRYGERDGQEPRSMPVDRPMPTIVPTGNQASLACAFLAKHYGGKETPGSSLAAPIDTITETDHHALVAANLVKLKGTCQDGQPVTAPLATVQAQGNHHALVASTLVQFNRTSDGRPLDQPLPTVLPRDKFAEVRAFLVAYYGPESESGQSLHDPMRTVTSKDRLALVTVHGVDYAIVDIGMRMLTARELANGQGFPPSYILAARMERVAKSGKRRWVTVTDTAQKEMVGNSVNPHVACALVRANLAAPVARERAA